MKSATTVLTIILFMVSVPLFAEEKLGIMLMHGKGGTSLPRSPIGQLAQALKAKGYLVLAPDMPWSRSRGFDKTYEDTMDEIDEAVKELRNKGATKVFVGGHSIGANAALGYGARRDGLAGILAIAPGHIPDLEEFQNRIDDDWKRAKKMVDAGEGNQQAAFKDLNQGRKSEKRINATVYLSWFNPDGPAVMPANTAKLRAGTPLLWIVGEKDRMYGRGKDYAYSSTPSHPKNAYVVVKGGHKVTPQKGERDINNWLSDFLE